MFVCDVTTTVGVTQQRDPSIRVEPYGTWFVSSVLPSLYEYGGGLSVINSSLVRDRLLPSVNQPFLS